MDVVWFSEIKWDYLRTRKQQIIRRRPRDVRVLYLEPFVRNRKNSWRLTEDDGVLAATVPFVKAVPSGVARALLDQPFFRSLVDWRAAHVAKQRMGEAGIDPAGAVAIVSNVYALEACVRFPWRAIVYDCNDAHSAFPGMPAWTRQRYEGVCRRADLVFASAASLAEDVRRVRGNDVHVELLGNGVEYGRFAAVRERGGPPKPGTVVGYLGAIAPWFDFELVHAVASQRPDWTFSLVGPVMLGADDDVRRLSALANVTVRDAVSYDDVPRVLSTFSIGLIPFRRNELTRGVNPNKMYEYLAMGVPVVATPFSEEVLRYPGVVRTGENAAAFAGACASFAEATEVAKNAIRREAIDIGARHDWDPIAAAFWERVARLFSTGQLSQ